MINNYSIELVMSEFGSARKNAGGSRLENENRLNPTLDSFLKLFPLAKISLFTDVETNFIKDSRLSINTVTPPFLANESRYGWRAHDYYQAIGLLTSTSDIAVAMDSDMLIVSPGFRAIVELARQFGLAVPINPRLLNKIDGAIGTDSTYSPEMDPTSGLGLAFNLTPIAFATANASARQMLERYCELMRRNPGRGAVHLARASFELGYHPCVLPPQWCVCSPRDLDSKHIWQEAIALHVGHRDVLGRWHRHKRHQAILVGINRFLERLRKNRAEID